MKNLKHEKIHKKENSFFGKGKTKREKESSSCSKNVAFGKKTSTKTNQKIKSNFKVA